MAALLLTIEWCKRHKLSAPIAATVDHGLRKGSYEEATRVHDWARRLGVEHHILLLLWDEKPPEANIQAVARDARYRQIATWARSKAIREPIKTLITGHTLDDQAETFLIRLARGSGLDGLSGMASVSPFPVPGVEDLTLMRPLLGFSHQRLVATLQAAKQTWIEDPTNDAKRFKRTQMRAARQVLDEAGLTSERLAQTAVHLRRAREAIEASVDELIAGVVEVSEWGYAFVRASELLAAPAEVGLRALARLLTVIGGEIYPPRFDAIETAWEWIVGGGEPKGRTLGGCRVVRRDNGFLIAREASAVSSALPLQSGESKSWDGRFRVTLAASAPAGAEVRVLGAKGLVLTGPDAHLPPVEPRRIAATTPALWTGRKLVAAPLCKYFAPGSEEFGFSATFLGLAKGKGAAKGNSL